MRNVEGDIQQEGLLSPVLEKKGILREKSSGRRPGDVTVPCWKNSKGLAIDVAVTSPFSKRNLTLPSPADSYGLKKHAKYDKGFVGSGHLFCAVVLETTGGVSDEGLSFFRQLFRFAARQQNVKLCVYAGRAWARISCNIQTSVAKALLVKRSGKTLREAKRKEKRHPSSPGTERVPEEAASAGVDSSVSNMASTGRLLQEKE